MGKERCKANGLKTFVFSVDMHRKCNDCIKKINDGMKRISLSDGVEWADLMVDKAEVEVVGTTDPEKLCCLLREVTKKHVKIRTENTVSEAGSATSQQTKGLLVGQYFRVLHWHSFSLESSSRVTPSAPLLAETWRQPDHAFRAMCISLVSAFLHVWHTPSVQKKRQTLVSMPNV